LKNTYLPHKIGLKGGVIFHRIVPTFKKLKPSFQLFLYSIVYTFIKDFMEWDLKKIRKAYELITKLQYSWVVELVEYPNTVLPKSSYVRKIKDKSPILLAITDG
jgi:hypothetical protein